MLICFCLACADIQGYTMQFPTVLNGYYSSTYRRFIGPGDLSGFVVAQYLLRRN